MYVDKLDGRIDRSFYVQMAEQWRVEQEKLMQEIALHEVADQCYLDEGVRLLELAQRAAAVRQTGAERATPHTKFCTIELDMEERRAFRHLPPTI